MSQLSSFSPVLFLFEFLYLKFPPPLLHCLGFSFDPYWRIDEFILFLWMFCIKLSYMYFGLYNIRDFCFCVTLGIFTFVAFKFDTL